MRLYLWVFWQAMSAVAHQGTLNASHCWCNVNSFYGCDCVGNCFSWIWTPKSIAPHEWWTTRQYQSTNRIFCSWLDSLSGPWSPLSGTSITLEHTNIRQVLESRVIGPSVTSTWQYTTLTTDRQPCPWRDSNPQSQSASGRKPTT